MHCDIRANSFNIAFVYIFCLDHFMCTFIFTSRFYYYLISNKVFNRHFRIPSSFFERGKQGDSPPEVVYSPLQ